MIKINHIKRYRSQTKRVRAKAREGEREREKTASQLDICVREDITYTPRRTQTNANRQTKMIYKLAQRA